MPCIVCIHTALLCTHEQTFSVKQAPPTCLALSFLLSVYWHSPLSYHPFPNKLPCEFVELCDSFLTATAAAKEQHSVFVLLVLYLESGLCANASMAPSNFLFYLVQYSSIYVVSFYSLVCYLLVFIAFKISKVRIYLNQILIQAIQSRCSKILILILIGSCSLLQGKRVRSKNTPWSWNQSQWNKLMLTMKSEPKKDNMTLKPET